MRKYVILLHLLLVAAVAVSCSTVRVSERTGKVRGLPARQAFCTKHEKEEVGLYPADHISQQAHISAAQTRNGNYPKLYGLYEQTNATAPDRYMSPEGLATRGR